MRLDEMKKRRRVYISGPMSQGDRLKHFFDAMVLMRQMLLLGLAPLSPQLSFLVGNMMPEFSWQSWLESDLAWVRVADAVYRIPGLSVGADLECEAAAKAGIPVFTSLGDLKTWAEAFKTA